MVSFRALATLSFCSLALTVASAMPPGPATPIQQAEGSFQAGNRLPDLTWQPVSGEAIRLRAQEGFALFIMFLDPNEKRCLDQLALVKPIAQRYGAKGLKVISVCAAAPADSLDPAAIFKAGGYDWPLVFWHNPVTLKRYGVSDLPLNCIVGRDGRVLMSVGVVSSYNQMLLEGNIVAALRPPGS